MSTGNWTMLNPVVPNQIITASGWNNEFQNVINNSNPDGVGTASESIPAMQETRDPYPGSIPDLAISLREEIESIRYQLNALIGKTYWYESPSSNIEQIETEIGTVGVTGGDNHDHTGVGPNGGGAPIDTTALADESVTTAKIENGAVTTAKLAFPISSVLQIAETTDNVFDDDFSGVIPTDVSIPQIGEGDSWLQLIFTPSQIGSKCMIDIQLNIRLDVNNTTGVGALFLDSQPDALIAFTTSPSRTYLDLGAVQCVRATFIWTSPDTNPHTFTINTGVSSGTYTRNPFFGTAAYSFLRIMEFAS